MFHPMFHQKSSRSLGLFLVLLALVASSLACSFPTAPGSQPATATLPAGIPTILLPSSTPPVIFTATPPLLPTATFTLPPAPVQPTNTRPAPAQPTNTRPAPALPTATRTPMQLSEVTIYFVAVGDDGLSGPKIGCGDSLVAVKQPIEPTSGVIRASLNRLFSFKQQEIGESGLYHALWQSDLALASARVDDGVATVYLTGQPRLGGECDTPRFIGQIEQTILAQPGVREARVFLNDVPIAQALSSR